MPWEEDGWPRDEAAADEDGVKVESPVLLRKGPRASIATATERATMTTTHSNKSRGADIRGKEESIVTLFGT